MNTCKIAITIPINLLNTIDLLAKKLGVAKSMLTLVKGETDRNKTFQFTGPIEPLEAFIASLTNTGKPDGEDH